MNINVRNESETTVKEYRAPTDESVRLLKELEEAARDKVLKSHHYGDTTFDGTLLEVKDVCNKRKCYQYIFSLNGKEFRGQFEIRDDGLDKAKQKLFKILSEAITIQLMTNDTVK